MSDDQTYSESSTRWLVVYREWFKSNRLDNGQEIQVNNGDYRCDRVVGVGLINLTIPFYEKSKLEPINGQLQILKIMVNGNEHRMLSEKHFTS